MPVPQTKILLSTALASGRALRFTPNAPGDFTAGFGAAPVASWLSVIDDLNGDGRPDFIFGAAGDDDKALDAGRIFISFDAFAPGTTNGVSDGLNHIIIDGVNAGDRAGAAVGSVSDQNGDGKAEILIGAPGMENGALVDAGAAFVIWGTSVAGGVDLNDPFTANGGGYAIKGQAAGDAAGTTIMSIADLNGDGKADILVGAPGNDSGGIDAGAVYVVWGKASDTIVSLDSVAAGTGGFKIIGEDGGDAVGAVLGTLGDINGDGKAEILIGAPDNNVAGANAGAAYVVFGKATSSNVDLAAVAAGIGGFRILGVAGDDAGAAISGLGDVNGDGLADILVGAPRSDSAYVVFGKAGTAEVDLADVANGIGGYHILAETIGDLDTISVAGGADLNRDGIADLVIGAASNAEGGANAGAVYVVWGGGSRTVDLSLVAQGIGGAKVVGAAGSLTGASIAITGDANGDGTADLMIGAPGTGESAYVLFADASWQPDNNIYGTAAADVIDIGYGDRVKVGATADIIVGLAGNDSIHGAGGNDIIEGGAGNDSLFGDAGNDVLDGGTGSDALAGGSGDDSYVVDSALDTIAEAAGDGVDTVTSTVNYTLAAELENLLLTGAARIGTGNAGVNTLTGTAFADTLDGAGGADTMIGGLGNDSYKVDDAGDIVTEAAGGGTDTVTSTIDYVLGDTLENLVLAGAARIATGNAGANALTGTAFADTLDGAGGADTMTGGLGDDLYIVDAVGDVVAEAAGGGTDTVRSGINLTLAANVENLVLTGVARIGTGNALANAITGTTGNDTLDGGAGADTLTGGLGDDTYKVDNIGDAIGELAGEGNDTVVATFDYALGTSEIENLTLSGAAHIGTGNAGSNVITGGSGNDTLDGGGGIDTLGGGAGDDIYLVDTATDTITETLGGGIDTVRSSVDLTLGAEVENLVLTGSAHAGTGNALDNVITGGAGVDTLTGAAGNDTLDGGLGADLLVGGAGDDTYFIDSAGDVVVEGLADGFDTVVVNSDWLLSDNIEAVKLVGTGHTLVGNAANNTLEGDIGDDRLDGGDGDDIEIGGDGDDHLVSGSGHDTLAGGAGDDVYELEGGSADIEDFEGHDTIDCSDASGDSYIDLSGDTDCVVEGQVCHLGTGGTITGTLNVQFLQDLTGSFGDDIATVRVLVPQIVSALQAIEPDAAFGVSTFRDKAYGSFGSAGDWVYRTDSAIGITPTMLTAAYTAMIASGGNDLPESQLEALMQLGLRAGTEVGFQTNAARFVVLFTDASFHVAGEGLAAGIPMANNGDAIIDGNGIGEDYPFIAQVKAALEAANIIPIFAVTGGFETTYQGLVGDLGRGTVVTLSANSSNVVSAITTGLTAATTTHIADAIGGIGDDTLIGNVGNNALTGNAGDDSLKGGIGDDALHGGIGSDTAVYAGARADYLVTATGGTSYTVTDLRATGSEGADTLTGIEFLSFSDGTVAVDSVPAANVAPNGATLATAVVDENAAPGTVIGTVVGSDSDSGDTLSYALVNDAGGRFAIDAVTGVLSVTAGAGLDFEALASHGISVKVTDQAGAFASFAFTIAVTNINDLAPLFASAAALSLAENTTAAGVVTASDPDALGSITYAITGGADAALFAIDATTGALNLVAAPNFELPLDAGADNIYDVDVTASDGGLSTVQAITVAVTDVFEAPTQSYTGTALADSFAVIDGNGWTLSGLGGNDTLTGGGISDVLIGGRGNDVLAGGAGADIFKFAVGDGIDSFAGGAGFDVIEATSANAAIGISSLSGIEAISAGGFAGVAITGSTGADALDFTGVVLTGVTRIDAGAGNDLVTGSVAADTIVLGAGNDVFHAGDGDDVFLASGSMGSDLIDGGAGADTIRAAAANASINAAALISIEAISGNGFANVAIIGSAAANVLDFSAIALTGIARIDAGAGNDVVTGSTGADTFLLGSGNDIFQGGDGDDVFVAKSGAGVDTIDGGAGHDVVSAASANLTMTLAGVTGVEEITAGGFAGVKLVGSRAADTMDYGAVTLTGITSIGGGAGNDSITGSAGDDRILGGTGADLMTGGLGADTFAFATTTESGFGATKADHILDFLSGTDVIDLSVIDANTALAGNQDFVFVGAAAFTGLGQVRIGVDGGGHVALFGNTTGTLTADFEISFDNNPALLPIDIHL